MRKLHEFYAEISSENTNDPEEPEEEKRNATRVMHETISEYQQLQPNSVTTRDTFRVMDGADKIKAHVFTTVTVHYDDPSALNDLESLVVAHAIGKNETKRASAFMDKEEAAKLINSIEGRGMEDELSTRRDEVRTSTPIQNVEEYVEEGPSMVGNVASNVMPEEIVAETRDTVANDPTKPKIVAIEKVNIKFDQPSTSKTTLVESTRSLNKA